MAVKPAAALLALVVAGCAAQPEGGVTLDAITPGAWDVRGETDHLLVHAHNGADKAIDGTWGLTGPGGAPLPQGWSVRFEPPGSTVLPDGRLAENGERADWTAALATLTFPANATAGTFEAELRFADARTPITLTVHANRGQVTGPGWDVTVRYEGRFHDSGEPFDDGQFPTTLGSRGTVLGFDFGLMGLAAGETATLVVPPPFGYGYDPPASHARFAGKTLEFEVTILEMER